MFFCRKKKLIKQLEELSEEYEWQERARMTELLRKENDKYCQNYPLYNFGEENIIIVDSLYLRQCPNIFIFKIIDRPIEGWMFSPFAGLEYFDWTVLVGRLECSQKIDETIKIERLYVSEPYRNKGIATYMMKRIISWGRLEGLSLLKLTAQTKSDPSTNELSQKNLLIFYQKLGFIPTKKNSNRFEYHYGKN